MQIYVNILFVKNIKHIIYFNYWKKIPNVKKIWKNDWMSCKKPHWMN